MDDVIKFGELTPEGLVMNEREIQRSDVMACPNLIIVPEHYNEDGSCHCFNHAHAYMAEWEYEWDETQTPPRWA